MGEFIGEFNLGQIMEVSVTELPQWTSESSWTFGTSIKLLENSSEKKLIEF